MNDIAWNTELYGADDRDAASSAQAPSLLDPRAFRNVTGSFATGVVAITYESGGRNFGVTLNSFTSVSLDPPLILVSLMRTSRALNYILERPFAVNVLGRDQLEVAKHFAGKPLPQEPRWVTDRDAPSLAGAMATLQCLPWAAYNGGDHVLVVGRVVEFEDDEHVRPLVFQRGRWTELAQGESTTGTAR